MYLREKEIKFEIFLRSELTVPIITQHSLIITFQTKLVWLVDGGWYMAECKYFSLPRKDVENVDLLFIMKNAEIFSLCSERTESHLVSGYARSLCPECVHHMLLTTSCSSHVDISPGRALQ